MRANDNPTRYTDPDGHEPKDSNEREPLPLTESQTQALVKAANGNEPQLEPMTSRDAKPKVVQEGRSGSRLVDARYAVPGQKFEELLEFGRQNPDAKVDPNSPAGRIVILGQQQAKGYSGPYESNVGGYTDESGFRHQSFCLSCHGNNEVAQLRHGAGRAATEWAKFDADVALMAVGVGETLSTARSASALTRPALEISAAAKQGPPRLLGGPVSHEEIEALFEGASTSRYYKVPGQEPTTGQGLTDVEVRSAAGKAIEWHDNMTFTGIKGAPQTPGNTGPGGTVQVRTHGPNSNAPAQAYSHSNPTTQITTPRNEFYGMGDTNSDTGFVWRDRNSLKTDSDWDAVHLR